MAKKKPDGFILYSEHVKVTRLLSDDERGRLLLAISEYADTSCVPHDESDAFMTCFELMRGGIDRQRERYAESCERNRRNVERRWAKNAVPVSVDGYDRIRSNTVVCNGIRDDTTYTNHTEPNQTEPSRSSRAVSVKASEPVEAFDGSDLSGQVANLQRADGLIRRYGLSDCDTTREALLEDAERVGWEKLEAALEKAAASNSRPGVSINFYRAVLNGTGKEDKPDVRRSEPYGGYGAL